MPPLLSADAGRCTGCGLCRTTCPHRIPGVGPDGVSRAEDAASSSCILCGHCAAVCPTGALVHRDLGPGEPERAAAPPAPGAVAEWLRARRSMRAYRPEPLSREEVARLLEGARHAPTGHNTRSLGCVAVLGEARRDRLRDELVAFYRRIFRVVRRPLGRAVLSLVLGRGRVRELEGALPGMARAEARLARGEDPLFHGAPAVLLFHAPDSETAEADCAGAATHVALLAPSLGLGTCHIGYASAALRRRAGLARRFGVPEGHRVYAVLAAGRPALAYPRVPPRPALGLRFL
ncbi:MAG: nitroreductase family protein [Deferrisomatales bacterium]